ncbi:MAG: transposase [Chloroflexi bacterium]|nr:transposase [Chloroflexota bacterium]
MHDYLLSTGIASSFPGAGHWGNATGQGEAALKLQVRLDVRGGRLVGLALSDGRQSDRRSPLAQQALPPRTLLLRDLGYFARPALRELDQHGNYFLTRLQLQTAVYDQAGVRRSLVDLLRQACARPGAVLDQMVLVGSSERLPVRLVAVRVPGEVAALRRVRLVEQARRTGEPVSEPALTLAEWTVLITNVAPALLHAQEALVLLAVRWQIDCCSSCGNSTVRWTHGGPPSQSVCCAKCTPS